MIQIQALENMSQPEVVALYLELLQRYEDDIATLSRELAVASEIKSPLAEIRVGQLPTMNQDEYPGLSDWWVQLRIGPEFDEVLARVYGGSPQQAVERAQALASAAPAPAASVDTSATCSCPSGNGSLRPWPCPVHLPGTASQCGSKQ